MKIKFSILALCLIVYARSPLMAQLFNQCDWNSSPNPNYCCGHDPELSPGGNDHHVFNWHGATSNFCNWGNYAQRSYPTAIYSTGDWMLIWDDEFNNYSKLDESFYRPVAQLSHNMNDGGFAITNFQTQAGQIKYMQDPGLIKINQGGNGKLQLYESYDPNPAKLTPLYNWGYPVPEPDPNNPASMISSYHCDYNVGHLETIFRFPKSFRIQSDIKTYPVNKNQWPAFWTVGEYGTELDVFEMPWQPSSGMNNSLNIMTYHANLDGSGTNEAEGLLHEFVDPTLAIPTPLLLNAAFHTYELIWDDWILQWWFDHKAVHNIYRYYKLHTDWSSNKRKKYYRALPVPTPTDFSNHGGQLFAENRHFPDFDDSHKSRQIIIFNNQLKWGDDNPLDPANIDPNASMDMDYLRVWVKADCSINRNVTAENINVNYDDARRQYLETGGTITFIANNNVTISIDQMGLFVATNQIDFEPGFSVDPGGSIFAFISYCEQSWDNTDSKEVPSDEPDTGPDDDNEPYYDQDGNIDDVDLLKLENSGNRTFNNSPDPESKGIIDMPTDASANNSYTNRDLLIKTDESGFTIESSGAKIIGIQLLDAKGTLIIKDFGLSTDSYKIGKTLLPEGIYTCMVFTTAGMDVRKLWVWK